MSSGVAVSLPEQDKAVSRKKMPLQAKEIPQSVFTKAMLEQMLAEKNTEEPKKTQQGPEKDTPSAGADAMSTTILYRTPVLPALNLLGIVAIKIDLKDRTDRFKDEYMKNYAMSKSHNLLVSRFAAMKYGFYGMMLSFLGVSADELQQLQKTARNALAAQNLLLFEENEYTGEMLEIMGGPKKKMKAERRFIDEMRKQLVSQLINCGVKDLCTPERLLEIQQKQCLNIFQKLTEEKTALEYELMMANTGLCQYSDGKDVPRKLDKIQKYITKTKSRLESHEKKAEVFMRKSKKTDPFLVVDTVKLTKMRRK
ncbi:MAG: hypothetical protein WC527_06120 [Candidatus Margulisiibacteriota bacterium]